MVGFIKNINNNFAAIISCGISLLTALTTVVYVFFTHHQMRATQDSVRLMQTEMKQDKQPCIIVSIEKVYSRSAIPSNKRRQMPLEFRIENISDIPALSLFCISYFELQNIDGPSENRIVKMFSGPLFIPFLKAGSSEMAHLHYENKQIDMMFKDLTICMRKNWERIRTDPSQNPYRGTELVIKIFYKNLNEQWFESKLTREILWAFDKTTKEKTRHNLNQYTFPPREIKPEDDFELQLASPYLSPLQVHMVSKEIVDKALEPYKSEWSDVFRAIV